MTPYIITHSSVYHKYPLLALRPHGGNTICLAMSPYSGKHPKQTGSDVSNLITVPITPYNGTAVQNINIGLINCKSICNQSDEISDVERNMYLAAPVIFLWCDSRWILITSDSQEGWGSQPSSPWFFEVWNLFVLSD